MLTKEEMQDWFNSFWSDIKGSSTRGGHPAPYPVELAGRLIKMFSFAGDTVLDPFVGTASTCIAAVNSGRNSIGNEIDPAYFQMAKDRLAKAIAQPRLIGATSANLVVQDTALNENRPVSATMRIDCSA
jgi:site-specific DNA-methyltransferase (adenine-specific)